jgi:azurin
MSRYIELFALLAALSGVACSAPPSTPPAGGDAGAAPAASSAAPATPVHDGRAIEITADDTMKFSVTEIAAKPGEKLSVTLVNLGTTPKFSMGHNWLLVAPMPDIQPFLTAAAEAMTTDYVPAGPYKDRVLAATKLLGPKERDTVTFTAPTTPGRYDFVCSFPGHYQVGMRGVLIVG